MAIRLTPNDKKRQEMARLWLKCYDHAFMTWMMKYTTIEEARGVKFYRYKDGIFSASDLAIAYKKRENK